MAGRKKPGEIEWTIENFSCWNRKVHGERLESPKFNFSAKFIVFPHGFQTGHTAMVVQVERTILKHLPWPGELFWLRSSDRKIIHNQMVNQEADALGKTPLPTFEKVVSQIREHEDRLTLRYKFENAKNFREIMCTVIEVIDVTLKMDTDAILSGEIKSDIDYSRTRKPAMLYLRSFSNKDKVAELTLELSEYITRKNCFVRSCVSFAEDTLLYGEHLFCDATPWVVMTMRERRKRGTHVLLRLRIAGGAVTKKHFLRLNDYGGTDTRTRYSICFAEGKSSTSVDHDSALTTLREETGTEEESSSVCSSGGKSSTSLDLDDTATIDWLADSYDLRLRCGDILFPVHKTVLSDRSPVFKTRLLTDVDSETHDITDLDSHTLGLFLTHLYTGSAGELQYDSALMLLLAAEKYQVPSLERECHAFFGDDINKCELESEIAGSHFSDREETGAEEASYDICSARGKSSTSLDLDDSATIDWLADSYDLRLRCGDILFPVHKTVLSDRSPVFETRLSTDDDSEPLDVWDLDPSTLRLLLIYLYTETVRRDIEEGSARKLYHAAEKYEVPSLKRNMCHLYGFEE